MRRTIWHACAQVGRLKELLKLQDERLKENASRLHRRDEQLMEANGKVRRACKRADNLEASLRVLKDEAAWLRRELDAATEELQAAEVSAAVAAVQQRHPVPKSMLPKPPVIPAPAAGSQPGGSTTAACREWATAGMCSKGVQCPFWRTHTLATQYNAYQQAAMPSSSAAEPPAPGVSV